MSKHDTTTDFTHVKHGVRLNQPILWKYAKLEHHMTHDQLKSMIPPVCKTLQTALHTCSGVTQNTKLMPRRVTKQRQRAVSMVALGASRVQFARKFGCSPVTVTNRVRRYRQTRQTSDSPRTRTPRITTSSTCEICAWETVSRLLRHRVWMR